MDEEKKTYSIVGTVTIGTDEYRDLIESVAVSKKQEEYYRNRFWEEQNKVSKLEKENVAIKADLDRFKKFVKENGEQDKMELWILKLNRED